MKIFHLVHGTCVCVCVRAEGKISILIMSEPVKKYTNHNGNLSIAQIPQIPTHPLHSTQIAFFFVFILRQKLLLEMSARRHDGKFLFAAAFEFHSFRWNTWISNCSPLTTAACLFFYCFGNVTKTNRIFNACSLFKKICASATWMGKK